MGLTNKRAIELFQRKYDLEAFDVREIPSTGKPDQFLDIRFSIELLVPEKDMERFLLSLNHIREFAL